MKGYDSYKKSNFEWFQDIPERWKIGSLNHLVTFIMGQAPHSDSYNTDGIGEIFVKTGDFGTLKPTPKWYTTTPLVYASEEDVFMCVVGATSGKVNLGINGTISRSIAALRPNKNINQKFLYYFLSYNYQIINDSAQGSAQGIINKTILSNIKMPIPSLEEQTVIASFLDYKTNLIDATIEKKKRLIELLKEKRQAVINEAVTKGLNPNAPMKNSGIEWLGEIPEHWVFQKAKRNTYMKGRIGWQGLKQEEFIDEGPYLITGMNFKDGIIRWDEVYHITKERYDEAPEIQLMNGDVLMTKDGTIGKLLYIDNLPGPASLNSHLLVLRCIDNSYLPKYLYFQLMTNLFKEHIELNKTGTTFFGITQEAVGKYQMLLPPISEQNEIINFIENQNSNFDKLIEKNNLIIEKLQTYRQSLISEAVTGKIDVRDWELKQANNI